MISYGEKNVGGKTARDRKRCVLVTVATDGKCAYRDESRTSVDPEVTSRGAARVDLSDGQSCVSACLSLLAYVMMDFAFSLLGTKTPCRLTP